MEGGTPGVEAHSSALPPPPPLPPMSVRAFLVAWAVFWLLLVTVSLQDHWQHARTPAWMPLVWEGTSCLVASLIVAALWRQILRLDAHLHEPWRWLRWPLAMLPLASFGFVTAVYALRHGLYGLAGLRYQHADWGTVYAYEMLKFAIFYGLFVALFFAIRSHAALDAQRLRAEHAARLANEARLLQLTQALEPHFLFNALNTIAATVHESAERADELITRLAAILRSATDLTRQPMVTLEEELRLLEHYAAIMNGRYGERASVSFEVADGIGGCRVPTLCLQPLLENAYRHGVEKHSQPTRIVVRAARGMGRTLVLGVEQDRGEPPGIRSGDPPMPAAAGPPAHGSPAGAGVGLSNLRTRLDLAYSGRAQVSLSARAGGGAIARIELPCDC